jgi:hypothetical protein
MRQLPEARIVMRQYIIVIILTFMLGLVIAPNPGQVLAQETIFPITPDPAQCVENMTIDQFRPLVVSTIVPSPIASPAVPEAIGTPSPFALPTGSPADDATIAVVTARVVELAACINAENTLGFYGQFSPDSVRQQLEGQDITDADVDSLAAITPVASPPDRWVTVIDIREVQVLPDGRVGALVDTLFPLVSADIQTDHFTFANIDGLLLIDTIVEGLETVYPPTATLATPAP